MCLMRGMYIYIYIYIDHMMLTWSILNYSKDDNGSLDNSSASSSSSSDDEDSFDYDDDDDYLYSDSS